MKLDKLKTLSEIVKINQWWIVLIIPLIAGHVYQYAEVSQKEEMIQAERAAGQIYANMVYQEPNVPRETLKVIKHIDNSLVERIIERGIKKHEEKQH